MEMGFMGSMVGDFPIGEIVGAGRMAVADFQRAFRRPLAGPRALRNRPCLVVEGSAVEFVLAIEHTVQGITETIAVGSGHRRPV